MDQFYIGASVGVAIGVGIATVWNVATLYWCRPNRVPRGGEFGFVLDERHKRDDGNSLLDDKPEVRQETPVCQYLYDPDAVSNVSPVHRSIEATDPLFRPVYRGGVRSSSRDE